MTWPMVISVQTITELRRAVKKFTSADVSVPASVELLGRRQPERLA